ncbi:MAG: hypothetical protein PHO02_07340 [Candidatus Nanoarchaeia archaeon]|nr:hypothetical protein [Candidatus Nanoarchaeia archaeon]
MNEKTPKQRMYRCIELIQKGYICFEDEAKELSRNELESEIIDTAVAEGACVLYSDYLAMISEGQSDYEPVARRLAVYSQVTYVTTL